MSRPSPRSLFKYATTHLRLTTYLRDAVAMPEIREAWIRDLPVGTPEPLEIDVVASVNALSWIAKELRTRLIQIEKRLNIIIELNIHTLADRLLYGHRDHPSDLW